MKKSNRNTYENRLKIAETKLKQYYFPPDFMGLYSYARSMIMHRLEKEPGYFESHDIESDDFDPFFDTNEN